MLVVRVTDGDQAVAARVLLFDEHNQPVHIGSIDLYGKRQGAAACVFDDEVVGSWDGLILGRGIAEVPVGVDACQPSPAIPYGRYHVWAWRGIEYERWEGDVDLREGRGYVSLEIALERAWIPHGTLAADLHVHAHASSDSTMPNPQRVVAQLAAGIQVIALTDHNTNGDLDAEIQQLEVGNRIASIAGNELTSNNQHVNVYPVPLDRNLPAGGAPPTETVINATPDQLFGIGRAMKTNPIVQVNHPRFRVGSMYDTAGWDGVKWPPPFPTTFDAVEVLAGYSAFNVEGDRRLDDGVRDLYTFYDHGKLVIPVANSDTHDLNWVLDGTARTYVFTEDTTMSPFDEEGFISALRSRRTVATTGPWLDVEVASKEGATPTVGPGDAIVPDGTTTKSVWLDITLSQTKWVHCERIRITIGSATGPQLVQTIDVPPNVRTHHFAGRIEVGAADTWIGVTADGDTAMPLEFTGTYQKDKWGRAGVTPFALASPILVDADNDGRWKRGDTDLPLR
ncbi:MAG TPA: CehA/McbA family metallohydrolase [Kofleriaceae bacterium]|nr:CehA/McbA family metallohydrolase [Kofleriaceae bacterium]